MKHNLTRRGFLASASIAGTASITGGLLVGCSTDGASPPPGSGGGGGGGSEPLTLPTYRQVVTAEPDLAPTAEGVPAGFFRHPRPPQEVVDATPGTGGTVSAMYGLTGSVTPTGGSNSWLTEMQERLGVTLDLNLVPNADYPQKFATALTGDLPDLVSIRTVPRLPELLESRFEDLTEHLSGDAVLDYPNLANLPTPSWQSTIFKGRIFTVPPQNLIGQPTWVSRMDLLKEAGANTEPTNGDEVIEMCRAVTDPARGRYAFGAGQNTMNLLACAMFDTANGWAIDDAGGFTYHIETEEYRNALEFANRMWNEEVIHPDAFGMNPSDALAKYNAGQVVFHAQGGTGYQSGILAQKVPGLELAFFHPPMADGSGPGTKRLGSGTFNLTAISKQDSPDRVRELLSILNYLASPWGSEEALFRSWGQEDVHYTWDDELDVPVDTGAPGPLQITYLAGPPFTLFAPGFEDATRAMHAHQMETIPTGRSNASAGLTSETQVSDGPNLTARLNDARDAVVQGRRPLSDWDAIVTEWRDGGGDKMREEYQTEYAAQQ